jgi:uncharacterized protein (DUF362 family)/Pyruvate/2-oxoacid:ferredoxin oxidoreductase delta subunit
VRERYSISTVILVKAKDYERQTITKAMEELFGHLEEQGFSLLDTKTMIKPNLLCAAPPTSAVCTHFSVIHGLVEQLHKRDIFDLSLGDSPGFGNLQRVAEAAGISQVCQETGVKLQRLSPGEEVSVDDGKMVRRVVVARPVVESDQIINVAKLKTHGLMGFTGAVKNLFGCVPGSDKATLHFRLSHRDHFAEMLVDLYLLIKPRLSIIDGIVGMEGQGPRQGNPRPLGVLIAGTDAVAVDAVACAVVGIDPMSIPTIYLADSRGVGQGRLENIRIIGANLDDVQVNDFRKADTQATLRGIPQPVMTLLRKQLTSRPYIIEEKCVGCGICVHCCPADTILLEETARIVDSQCIRCYCCHELCPQDAVGLVPGFLQRVIGLFR